MDDNVAQSKESQESLRNLQMSNYRVSQLIKTTFDDPQQETLLIMLDTQKLANENITHHISRAEERITKDIKVKEDQQQKNIKYFSVCMVILFLVNLGLQVYHHGVNVGQL